MVLCQAVFIIDQKTIIVTSRWLIHVNASEMVLLEIFFSKRATADYFATHCQCEIDMNFRGTYSGGCH